MKRINPIIVICFILVMILLASGCSKVNKIADITANSAQYNGKTVNISGYVSNTLWVAVSGRGAYQVDDGSGTIWVVTNKEPPLKGVKVSVKGTVSPAFTLGDKALGTVVNETNRN